MAKRYGHIGPSAQRQAMAALDARSPKPKQDDVRSPLLNGHHDRSIERQVERAESGMVPRELAISLQRRKPRAIFEFLGR